MTSSDLVESAFGVLRDSKPVDDRWFGRTQRWEPGKKIAYFCAEFGLSENLPIYSGGLGILAGDHLKSSSDLGIPLVAVGLLYKTGYFRQEIDADGGQLAHADRSEPEELPVISVDDPSGGPVKVEVPLRDASISARVWKVQVGSVPLYLLDTDVPENSPKDREITQALYGGGIETRLRQEIVLAIGGYRALQALGHDVSVYHMNEGHAAFVALERILELIHERGIEFEEASEIVRRSILFTTHTPVPAGHDHFSPELVEKYLAPYTERCGLDDDDLMSMGRENPENKEEYFSMTVFGLRLSEYSNAVSDLNGEVTREMWHKLWPDLEVEDVPIGQITNAIHLPTWLSKENSKLLEKYLGDDWIEQIEQPDLWKKYDEVKPEEIWNAHAESNQRLAKRVGLDPDFLTIGFARRFATYKRSLLIFHDLERLEKIINSADRPVQFVFAGKAHPQDEAGKALIKQLFEYSQSERLKGRIYLLENYDMAIARDLVQGCDVWLNTPIRPHEASGTSGMKAAVNGVLNLSILDGWWAEAFMPELGWAFGDAESESSRAEQDRFDAESLYEVLENQVIPLYYERDASNLPIKWIEMMKASIRELSRRFHSDRMLKEYVERYYLPASRP